MISYNKMIFAGSDLKALCSEAVLKALRRVYPQVYESEHALLIDANKVSVHTLSIHTVIYQKIKSHYINTILKKNFLKIPEGVFKPTISRLTRLSALVLCYSLLDLPCEFLNSNLTVDACNHVFLLSEVACVLFNF